MDRAEAVLRRGVEKLALALVEETLLGTKPKKRKRRMAKRDKTRTRRDPVLQAILAPPRKQKPKHYRGLKQQFKHTVLPTADDIGVVSVGSFWLRRPSRPTDKLTPRRVIAIDEDTITVESPIYKEGTKVNKREFIKRYKYVDYTVLRVKQPDVHGPGEQRTPL